jgi:hypothetical protein
MNTIQKRAMPLWFKFLIAISIIALAAVITGILFTERWVGVVEGQLQELKEGDVKQAYYLYTSKAYQSTTPFEKFQTFINSHPVFFSNPSVQFPSRGLNHNISTLKGKLVDLNRQPVPIEYRLIKEEGKWKILSINFIEKPSDSELIENK